MQVRQAEVYIKAKPNDWSYLPEGPRIMTIAGSEHLVWVNIQNGAEAKSGMIFAHHLKGAMEDRELPCPGRPGFVLPVMGGDRVLVGMDKELRYANLATGAWSEPIGRIPDDNPRTMLNDAEVVPGGEAIVCGTKDSAFKDAIANLYLFTLADRRFTLLADKQKCSNGKVFYSDDNGLILFDIDTPTHRVARYRLDLAARQVKLEGVAVDLSGEKGSPDGMCDCGDGTAVIALYNHEFAPAGRAVRYNLFTGKKVEEWHAPGSPRVTKPVINDSVIYMTTALEGMPADLQARCPNSGSLFESKIDLPKNPRNELVLADGRL